MADDTDDRSLETSGKDSASRVNLCETRGCEHGAKKPIDEGRITISRLINGARNHLRENSTFIHPEELQKFEKLKFADDTENIKGSQTS